MRARVPALLVLPWLAACQPAEPVGYVEVKRSFVPASGDVFRLNGRALDELKRNASVVIRQKAGPVKLELDRAGNLSALCAFDLGRNRIATASMAIVDGRLKCGVQL